MRNDLSVSRWSFALRTVQQQRALRQRLPFQMILAIAAGLASFSLSAEEQHCLPVDTPRQCVARLVAEARMAAEALAAAANTGVQTVGSPARSAVKDFLSTLSTQFDGAPLLKDRGDALTVDFNLPR